MFKKFYRIIKKMKYPNNDSMAIDNSHLVDSYRDRRPFKKIIANIDWLEKIK